ncbi:hypothetical protein [Acetobacter fabarum]|uniref:hypothetical protein n=1 Tax=Acetobacter fabarum TaxID=483199 RepID=UPI001178BE2A|nr:hypothetical protein [Acetobacter fabarum]
MSLISAIRAAFSFSANVADTLSNGLSEAAGADVQKRLKQNMSSRQQNHEPSDGDKKEKEKASQPAVTFTIPEHAGPIKEPEFKPEPLPPLPPKPPPLPPKKPARINNASKQKPLPVQAKPPPRSSVSRQPRSPASQQPRTALGKMVAAQDKARASASEQKQTEKKDGRSL